MAAPGVAVNLSLFLGEDKIFADLIYAADGVTLLNITGFNWKFVLHRYGDPFTVYLTKTTGDGGITTVTPTGGSYPAQINIQVNRADTANADGTPLLFPGEYEYYIVRTDAGNDTEPTRGCFSLLPN